MAMSMHTNITSLITRATMDSNQQKLGDSMARLGTGFKINSSKDDAAGLQIAMRLQAQSGSMEMAMRNAQNGVSMLQTADAALGTLGDILLRMSDLAVLGANGATAPTEKQAIQKEYNDLGKELANIISSTSFGGQNLLSATGAFSGGVNMQIGGAAGQVLSLDVSASRTALHNALVAASAEYSAILTPVVLNAAPANNATRAAAVAAALAGTIPGTVAALSATDLTALNTALDVAARAGGAHANYAAAVVAGAGADDVVRTAAYVELDRLAGTGDAAATSLRDAMIGRTSPAPAPGTEITGNNPPLATLSTALAEVGSLRASFGANSNRLDYTISNLSSQNKNTKMSLGGIRDTDFAEESAKMSSGMLLQQVSTAMLKQTGQLNQLALSLVQ